MKNLDYKAKVELGVSAVVLIIGFFFVYQSFTIETSREAVGPRTMPLMLAVGLVLGGFWLAIRVFLGKSGDLKEGYGFQESDIRRISLVIGCGALFVLLFWAFGYFTALIFTFIATLLTFDVRRWIILIPSAVVLAFLFQALFMGVMRLNDPKGAVVDMHPYTNWITGAK